MPSFPIITLTTDFGLADPYVGVMKGVILSITPDVRLVDLSHEVAPFDTEQAAFLVSQAVPYFPAGTIHLLVVDPGVGGPRRALVAHGKRAAYVGPDNGVLGPLLAEDSPATVHEIGTPDFLPRERSATFHGRDVFSPCAAHLVLGRPLADFGPPVDDDLARPFAAPERTPDGWRGRVLHVDRFGNLITNLGADLGRELTRISVAGAHVPVVHRYGDVPVGEPGAVAGSSGRLEIFVREGSARARLGAGVGDVVEGRE